ncbi:sugar ABC transporter substrate-binding protein [Cnuibacter physcomitrellae]|uniref:sugar ABC transporter substrate-binding protein n=1 Tax=Cnuibacter physcomitrellae TaxID=1619308 RepID=UPI0021759AE1|nr:sugar ABC transporter substrate-binding protein [Cnuibacter physcomitrellae]MCS5497127.1 sugar ABC transporter substrate-binding protein [Cnuibacter physcomitrellae]
MTRFRALTAGAAALAVLTALTACGTTGGSGGSTAAADQDISVDVSTDLSGKRICFGFSGSETEFWAAGIKSISDSLSAANATVIEHNSNEDPNRQLEQVRDCITQGVDGIIVIPEDGSSANTIIKEANDADIPIGIFNRPPATEDGAAIISVADNRDVAAQTVQYLADEATKLGRPVQPLIMVGNLSDQNAVERRNGFYEIVDANPDLFLTPIEVQTNWDAATGQANLQAAMQANPNVDVLFTSSDFLFPQIQAVLEPLGKWKAVGEEGHVIMGGLDGDNRACGLIETGYVDATGVQDLFSEASALLDALGTAIQDGDSKPDQTIVDPGFALTAANFADRSEDMWGCVITPPAS